MSEEACARAKDKAGGNSALAIALNQLGGRPITAQAISQWKIVPDRRVLDVERVTGVPRSDLRPDLYPPAPGDNNNQSEAAA